MIVDQRIGRILASSTAWLPLLYDTVVVSFTLYRTANSVYSKSASNLFRVLLREGLLYYSVICTITLVLTIMITSTGQSIRNIASQLHLCLTVAMMSRITLHLRRFANNPNKISYHEAAPQLHPHQHFLSSITQADMSFAPPPPTLTVLSSIYTPELAPEPKARPNMRPLPPVPVPRNDARAAAAASSLENGTYLAMETFSTVMAPVVPVCQCHLCLNPPGELHT
jgi:hypothetical protein